MTLGPKLQLLRKLKSCLDDETVHRNKLLIMRHNSAIYVISHKPENKKGKFNFLFNWLDGTMRDVCYIKVEYFGI